MEEKLQPSPAEIIQLISERNEDSKVEYKHRQAYEQFFADAPTDKFTKEDLIKMLHSEGIITYNKYSDDELFVLSAKRGGTNRQILTLKVRLGSFMLNISALIQEGQSKIHSLHKPYSAQDKAIYHDSIFFPKTIVKCFAFNSQNFESTFLSILNQVCISKICSAISSSPSLKNICEFDLIIFDECIQIFMEKCINIQQLSVDLLTSQKLSQLKTKLKRLHSLQVVHNDIKVDNICFSPSLGEFVFIDFGLSRFTGQKIGEKTLTKFMGTQGYYSEEMKKCIGQKMNFVDLYYNDVHSLNITFFEIEKTRINKTNKNIKVDPQSDNKIYQSYSSIPFITPLQDIRYQSGEKVEKAKQIFQMITKINAKYYIKQISFEKVNKFLKNSYQSNVQLMSMHFFKSSLNDISRLSNRQKVLYIKQARNTLFKIKQNNKNQTFDNKITDLFSRFVCLKGFLQKQQIGIIKKNILMSTQLYLQETVPICEIILNKSKVQNLSKQLYFQYLVSFLDFKRPNSTYKQKVEASQLFFQIMNIPINNKIDTLTQANQNLLAYFLEENNDSFIREIPILYSNLIILRVSIQQLFTIFIKTLRKPMSINQYFQILIQMVTNTYWILFDCYSQREIFILIHNASRQIKRYYPCDISQDMKNELQLHFKIIYKILSLKSSKDDQLLMQIINFKSCRFIEKQILNKYLAFYYYHQLRNHISHQHNNIAQIIKFYSTVSKLQQTIDYYHLFFSIYYRDIRCHKELQNLKKKFQICLDNRNLMLNNSIYWVSNPFEQHFKKYSIQVGHPQPLKIRCLQFLDSILIKFSNCTNRESKFFYICFQYLLTFSILKRPQYTYKMQQIYCLSKKLLPILYQVQLQAFLQQFDNKIIFMRTKQVDSYFVQFLNIENYIPLMLSVYSENSELDIPRLIRSYNGYLQKKYRNQDSSNFVYESQQEIHRNYLYLYEHQEKLKQYFQIANFYLSSYQFIKHKLRYQIGWLLSKGIDKIPKISHELKQLVDEFINIAIKYLIDEGGFLLYQKNVITLRSYTIVINYLLNVMNNPSDYCRVIFTILKFIYHFPNKENINFLMNFILSNYGYWHKIYNEASFPIYSLIKKKITSTEIEHNPYLLFLYVFIRLQQRQQKQELMQFFEMMKKTIQKMHKYVQSIIRQIIFYKIVSKDLQFFNSLQSLRKQQQQLMFQSFANKQYLKQPINYVNIKKFTKLLIKKHYSKQQFKGYSLTELFQQKLNNYHRIVHADWIQVLRNFPNPFKKHK